ncbi:MAG: hypothetical protein CMA72_06900 [Euryarchaeota archaeon]|nr:hypothetical protein [Euryarchaeota archaeon]|tara:strand:+ start:13102 stop:13443 length:342 start_codon:yes stop_codon:yes gene_type:complete
MEQSDIITLLVAVVGTLGGASAWQFYQKKLEIKAASEEKDKAQQHVYRDDLRERVAILEAKLDTSRSERDELLEKLRILAEETAALRVEVQFLREEREKLTALVEKLSMKGNS